jgi:hypothetical protein
MTPAFALSLADIMKAGNIMIIDHSQKPELTEKDKATVRYALEYMTGDVARYKSKRTDYLMKLIARLARSAGVDGK